MKIIISCLILFVSTSCFSQKDKGSIVLIDGSVISGLVKINSNTIKFKDSKNSKSVEYDFKTAKSATFYDQKNKEYKYEFITIENKENPVLFKLEIDGYLKLYSESLSSYGGMSGFRSSSTFYIKKENEPISQYYVAFGYIPKISFNNVIESYFTDCKAIQDKVKNGDFKKKDYFEIIEYYNANCARK